MKNLPFDPYAILQPMLQEYSQFLQSDEAKCILDDYSKVGGDASRLRDMLWWVRALDLSPVTLDPRTRKAMQRLLNKLDGVEDIIADMEGLKDVDDSLWSHVQVMAGIKRGLRRYIELTRERERLERQATGIQQAFHEFSRNWRKLPPRRRGERGYAREHLIAAVLVDNFRCRFGQPHYKEAARLLYEASRTRFATLSGEDAPAKLARLVKRIPPGIVQTTRKRLDGAPPPLAWIVQLRPSPIHLSDLTK